MDRQLDVVIEPLIRSKEPITAKRLSIVLTNFEYKTGKEFKPVEIADDIGVNKNFLLFEGEKVNPSFVVTLFNNSKTRRSFNARQRAIDSLSILNDELPKYGDIVRAEKLVYFDSKSDSIVATFEHDNVVRTPSLTAILLAETCATLGNIKPSEDLKLKFPHQDLVTITTPERYVEQIITPSLIPFYEWYQMLGKGELGASPSERVDYLDLYRKMEKRGILPRTLSVFEKLKTRISINPDLDMSQGNDFGFSSGDGRYSNYLFETQGGGGVVVNLIDTDTFQWAPLNFLASLMVHHPGNREIFGSGRQGDEVRKLLFTHYSELLKLDSAGIKNLNTLNSLVHMGWIARFLRNMAVNRTNWSVVMGGVFPNKAKFLSSELDVLEELLSRNPEHLDIKAGETQVLIERPEVIQKAKYPLTGESPITRYQEWVSRKVRNLKKHMLQLNQPLVKLRVAHPFLASEALNNPPYILSNTFFSKFIGSGVVLAKMRFNSIRSKSMRSREFGYITRTMELDKSGGGLYFVLVEGELPHNIINRQSKPIHVPADVLVKLQESFNRFRGQELSRRPKILIQKMREATLNLDSDLKVNRFTIHPEHNDFFTIVTAHISNGQEVPMKLNRVGEMSSEQATGYIVITNEGKYRFILNTRVCIPPRNNEKETQKKESLETARGFSDPDNPFNELYQELGMIKGGFRVDGGFMIHQSFQTDAVTFPFYIIREDSKFLPEKISNRHSPTDEGWEENIKIDLSPKEVFDYIKNGKINDGFTIYSVFLHMLRDTDYLVVNPDKIKSRKILMERKFILQEGSDKLVIPRGDKFGGINIGNIYPNTGSDRIVDTVNTLNLDGFLGSFDSGNRYVALDISTILESIKNGEFDTPTAYSLILGMVDQEFIKFREN